MLDPRTGKPLQLPAIPSLMSLRASPSNCPVRVRSGRTVRLCRRREACSLCKLDTRQSFTLRGAPHTGRDVDTTYNTHISFNHSLGFVGRRNTDILLSEGSDEMEWLIRSKNESEKCIFRVRKTEGSFPVGRNVWRSCSSHESVELSLTQCSLGTEFTCNDGTCIPLSYKCDMFPDCSEGEDEEDCNPLVLPSNYQRQVQGDNVGQQLDRLTRWPRQKGVEACRGQSSSALKYEPSHRLLPQTSGSLLISL